MSAIYGLLFHAMLQALSSKPQQGAPAVLWGCCSVPEGDVGFTPGSWHPQGNALSAPNVFSME